MLQTAPSFARATQDTYQAELQKTGPLFEAFFKKNGVSVEAFVLHRNGNSYPVLMLTPDESTMDELSACFDTIKDRVCSHLHGLCLAHIACSLEEGEHHPEGIALVAHQSIINDFALQLSALHDIEEKPRPAIA